MKLSIIIPSYNSSQNIEKLISKIKNVDFGSIRTEIIVVNDASKDNTAEILKKITGIKAINHKTNTGKGGAVATGLKNATGDLLFIQDDDLEYFPEDIPKIIKPILDKKANASYGSRRLNKNNSYSSPFYYWGGVAIDSLISFILKYPLTDAITGSKAFTKEVYEAIKPIETKGFEVEAEITAKIIRKGFKIHEIPIIYNPRTHKEGKNIRWHDGIPMLKTLIRYSSFS